MTIRRVAFLFALAIVTIAMPRIVQAAELTVKALAGDGVLEVRVDPQSQDLNVIEGTLLFSGEASEGLDVQIENGHSILSLWPVPPRYDADTKSIQFVGGVPQGFRTEGLLFRIRIASQAAGALKVALQEGNSYVNDGKGTIEKLSSVPLELQVNANGGMSIAEDIPRSKNSVYGILIVFMLVLGYALYYYGFTKKH